MEDLARRYVDLWQDQMTALAADPEVAGSLQKVMSTLGIGASGLPAMWSAWPAALTGLMAAAQPGAQAPQAEAGRAERAQADEEQESHGKPGLEPPAGPRSGGEQVGARRPAAAARSAAAAAASHGGGVDLGRLEARLAALEQRLASLEGTLDGRSGGKGGSAKARPKRR